MSEHSNALDCSTSLSPDIRPLPGLVHLRCDWLKQRAVRVAKATVHRQLETLGCRHLSISKDKTPTSTRARSPISCAEFCVLYLLNSQLHVHFTYCFGCQYAALLRIALLPVGLDGRTDWGHSDPVTIYTRAFSYTTSSSGNSSLTSSKFFVIKDSTPVLHGSATGGLSTPRGIRPATRLRHPGLSHPTDRWISPWSPFPACWRKKEASICW